ncbi:MAG: protein kinase [Anaerolineae bacterium]|nr:protein kinase [Anaerolineae bacterium]
MSPNETMNGLQSVRKRYALQEPLGSGGMGVVYRTYDRLTRQTLALKRVVLPPELASMMDDSTGDTFYLGLAKEFQILASLRHPNIISVYDYGFDEDRQPYLVMELLEGAKEATAQDIPLSTQAKLDLTIQMLEALAYLHRRGVIHRDLKPSNVLVTRDSEGKRRVKLLDFGLSIRQGESGGAEGTLTYMAPEVLQGEPASFSADLYSAGALAYELFFGKQPFGGDSLDELIDNILTSPVDFSGSEVAPPVVAVIRKLLARSPQDRYSTAHEALSDVTAVTGGSPVETAAIRESFLQAAEFVGRDFELSQLSRALSETIAGKGSAWLVGGESGIGKSRLLEELRIRALVEGVIVLREWTPEANVLPFQLWREPLRRLLLTTEITDLEASVLKPLVPDIETLLNRPVKDPSELSGQLGIQRLTYTIANIVGRQKTPLLLIVEDLQWAVESLGPLKMLCRIVSNLPVMVVGSFRSDETPALATELADMRLLQLERLDEKAIARLSQLMIGPAGENPQVVKLLQQETEGNLFFLVEIVRALAEESGSLIEIGNRPLPVGIVTSGLQSIIDRRINRVSTVTREWLKLAAVLGREIDVEVLKVINPQSVLDARLLESSSASVLELQDNQWRFAHEKFRESLMRALSDDEKKRLHHESAQALEKTYGKELSRAGQIAMHWRKAEQPDKERYYCTLASEYFLSVNLFKEAGTFAQRAFELSSLAQSREIYLDSLVRLVRCYWRLSEYQQARPLLEDGISLAKELNRNDLLVDLLLIMGGICKRVEDVQEGQKYLFEALTLARQHGFRNHEAEVQLALINPLMDWDLAEARKVAESAHDIYNELGDEVGIATAIFRTAMTMLEPQELAEAKQLYLQAADIFKKHGIRSSYAQSLMRLVSIDLISGEFDSARRSTEECLRIVGETGGKSQMAYVLVYLSQAEFALGKTEPAFQHLNEALEIFRSTHEIAGTAFALCEFGELSRRTHALTEARGALEESIALCRKHAMLELLMRSLTFQAMSLADTGDLAQAAALGIEAIVLAHKHGLTTDKTFVLSGLAYIYSRSGKDDEAMQIASLVSRTWPFSKSVQYVLDAVLESARNKLTAAEYDETVALSLGLSIDEAVSNFAKE